MAGPLDIRNVAQRSGKIGARRSVPLPVQLRHIQGRRDWESVLARSNRVREGKQLKMVSPSTLIIHVDLEVEVGQ